MNEGDSIRIFINGNEHYFNEHETLFDPGDEFGTLCDPYCPEGPFEIRIQLNTFDTTISVDPEVIEGLVLGIDPQQEPIIIYDSTRAGILFHKGEPCCFE